ncbi:alkylation response protein AidB-like acyl-CoA dehydrogenase [Tepidamorphus gemmatus]|uniref:Medium-chain specific acyl-CoA dehydrogenase, mitochondrial n=1 Tax=Tepidamorphus gemmatus TaxID=747076 RepID=A0A4R3ME71_9HYPH|nr:acyl-CoA dehydrogenase family protein [Tepidamorphus gemmatus]TCT10599.1 alkylation response protein AidB-like acyl-CoA dehydrogenase [Tepidamorphus gemmatus]
MSFHLPPSALDWQAKVRAFVDEELIPWEIEAEMNGGEIPPDVAARHERIAIGLGLSRMDVPVAYGGLAAPVLDQVVAAEQIGRVTNALGWCYPEAQGWMFEACSADQLERFVLPMMRGERHFCYAITEEGAGSNVDDIVATARRDGGDYVIDAVKWHVTSANLADTILVQAKMAEGRNAGTHGLFFVEADATGISTVRNPAYSHTYRHHHPILRFDGVRVPAANLIGREGEGMDFTYAWFRRERLMIAARACGAAERLIEEARAFAATRVVGGVPIAEHQLVQAMLADSVVDLHAARLVTYEAAAAHDRGLDVKALHARCSIAKLLASEAAGRIADRAVQIFGGRGYMRENVAERFLRELRVDRIWEGTSEIQRLIIANGLMKRGLAGTIGAS